MKRATITLAVVTLVLSAAMLVVNVAGDSTSERLPPIGMTQIALNKEYMTPDGLWLSGFVPSGSTDKRVLISINGHWVPGGHVDYVAASAVVSDILGPGIKFDALTDGRARFPEDVGLVVTIMQPGARFGKPRAFHKPLEVRQP